VRGRDRDLLIDTGFGVASLHHAALHLFDKPLTAVATHAHVDHVGSFHEFPDRVIHQAEAADVAVEGENFSMLREDHPSEMIGSLEKAGYEVGPTFITALPRPEFNLTAFCRKAAPATRTVEEGDVIDLGDRVFEVLHLPGHSPGSIGLWESASATLFSGDAIYDGPLLDDLPGSDVAVYLRTMRRLESFPARIVHAGHDPSFDGRRLKQLARAYLDKH
jgi:glyoxylase-like metal-dependent hydrolase (beta-lactamase superfamily II)